MVELGPQAYKIVRQCMRQLDLLKNVWQTILPEIIYNKSLGMILNDLCDEIIRKVVSREDISSAVANGLVNICDVILERGPSLFAVSVCNAFYEKCSQSRRIVFMTSLLISGSIGNFDICEVLGEIATNQNDFECIDGANSRSMVRRKGSINA